MTTGPSVICIAHRSSTCVGVIPCFSPISRTTASTGPPVATVRGIMALNADVAMPYCAPSATSPFSRSK